MSVAASLITLMAVSLLALALFRDNNASTGTWKHPTSLGQTQANHQPALAAAGSVEAVIWQSAPAGQASTLSLWASTQPDASAILPYPDVSPVRLLATAANSNRLHLVWLESDHRLRSALIDATGTTLRGPITLAAPAESDFSIIRMGNGQARVIWRGSNSETFTCTLDHEGRPGPVERLSAPPIQYIAAASDPAGSEHFLTLQAASSGSFRLVRYQVLSDNTLSRPDTLTTVALEPDQALAGLEITADTTHLYVFWSLMRASNPDRQVIRGLAIPLSAEDAIVPLTLELPQQPDRLIEIDHIGAVWSPATNAASNEPKPASSPLRWLRAVPSNTTVAAFTVTVSTSNGWRPAIVYLREGHIIGHQIIANRPANAGPVSAVIAPNGQMIGAWSGLVDGVPILFTARLP